MTGTKGQAAETVDRVRKQRESRTGAEGGPPVPPGPVEPSISPAVQRDTRQGKVPLTCHLPLDLKRQVEETARAFGISQTAFVIEAINFHIERVFRDPGDGV